MELVFRDNPYAKQCEATVTAVDERGIQLDRTVFYPMGGGQMGDTGRLVLEDGSEVAITDTVKGDGRDQVLHVPAADAVPVAVGAKVSAELDWERRYRLMRMHTCLHLLSAVLPYPVTGGQVSDGRGRLDFNLPDMPKTKDEIGEELNRLIAEDHEVRPRWISDRELRDQPDLVKTMSVKPPMGSGHVRLVEIADVDLQPCGGTHVAHTGEIGRIRVAKIENKGRQNRRVAIVFDQ